jgi:hypothetical protein
VETGQRPEGILVPGDVRGEQRAVAGVRVDGLGRR